MTPNTANTSHDELHREICELLPWYVNGALGQQETLQVEAQLALCQLCQEELDRCRDLAAAVQAVEEVAWEPSAAHLTRLWARIDTAEQAAVSAPGWRDRIQRLYDAGRAVLHNTPPVMRWALATQGGLVLLLAGMFVWHTPVQPKLYPTLSTVPLEATRTGPQIRVVFAEDVLERELRAVLTSVGGTIVQGPSPMGVYTVEIPPSASLPMVLERLRTQPQVRLAEPIITR
jgi:hypothetical protein